jgi:hypothetical protein
MRQGPHHESRHQAAAPEPSADRLAVARRPTPAQRRYLERGLTQPGGKLPLFDRNGREVAKQTIESCIAQGWAVPWGAQSDQAGLAGVPAFRGRLSGAGRRAAHARHRRGDARRPR